MIAHVALTRRMPRKLDALSYLVPSGLTVRQGDLVIVPFRSTSVRGVVLSLEDDKTSEHSGAKLKFLERVEIAGWMSDTQLGVFASIATRLLQSTSTMMHEVAGAQKMLSKKVGITLPRPGSSIRRSEVPHVQAAVEFVKSRNRCFIQATDVVQMTAIAEAIKKTIPGSLCVFVPHHHNAELIPGSQTRIGSLKITHHRPDPITNLVLRSGTPEYASYDRNPRYDARDILLMQQKAIGGKVIFMDVVPSVNDLVNLEHHLPLPSDLVHEVDVINLIEQKKLGSTGLLSDPLIAAITEAVANKKSILLSYNRKGVATGLLCRDCGYAPRCKTCGGAPTVYGETLACHHCGTDAPMLTQCPKCKSLTLKERGTGNQQIEKQLQKLFPDVEIQRIEKPSKKSVFTRSQPDDEVISRPIIILATRHYLDAMYDPSHPPAFGLVADLMGDLGLSDPSYDATEQTLLRLSELRGVAFRAKCPFIVQAFDASLIKKMLLDPHSFLEEERAVREQANFPPYGTIYRLSPRGDMTIARIKELLGSMLAGLSTREHEEHKKPVLEIYVNPGMAGNLGSALKQLPDDVIIQLL